MVTQRFLFLLAFMSTALPGVAQGQDEPLVIDPSEEVEAFDKDLAISAYGVGWAGDYLAGGVGARLRWEMMPWLGIDLFTDQLIVENPGGLRHDHQIGFNTYIPIALSSHLRLRPLFGFCAVFSFIEPEETGAPRADDIFFGIHGGIGLEWAFSQSFSFFADLQGTMYLAHDRSSQGWTGSVGEEIQVDAVAQLATGVSFHFDL